MTEATLSIDAAPGPRGWRALFWLVPLIALWIAVNYAFPAIGASGVPTAAACITIHVMIAMGLGLGLERAELAPSQRRNVWLAVMIPLTVWLAIVWSAAINGVFKPGGSVPLVPFAIFVPVIIGAAILLNSRRIGQLLDAMPAGWIIALQFFRVLGSSLLVGWAYGALPGVFALPVGVGDILTGLFAVPVAISLSSGSRESRLVAIGWNIFGLADFAIALSIGVAISLFTRGGVFPGVMIPTFIVPSGIMLHAVSLRQLRRRNRAATQ